MRSSYTLLDRVALAVDAVIVAMLDGVLSLIDGAIALASRLRRRRAPE